MWERKRTLLRENVVTCIHQQRETVQSWFSYTEVLGVRNHSFKTSPENTVRMWNTGTGNRTMYRILGTSLQSRDITVVIPSYDTWPDGDALDQASQYVFFPSFSSMFPETKTSNEQQNTKMHRLVQTQHHTNERKSKSNSSRRTFQWCTYLCIGTDRGLYVSSSRRCQRLRRSLGCVLNTGSFWMGKTKRCWGTLTDGTSKSTSKSEWISKRDLTLLDTDWDVSNRSSSATSRIQRQCRAVSKYDKISRFKTFEKSKTREM